MDDQGTDQLVLHTKLDPAFGLLGAVLVISGLILASAGSAYHRLSIFITTFYSFSLVTLALILHFGVEKQVSDPSKGVRIAFFLACMACGATFGVASVVFYRGMKIGIAPAAGFILAVTIQSLKSDGLIAPLGFRYLFYLGVTAVLFLFGIVPRFFDATLLVCTAFLGALAFVLGVDCFSTANLKEFMIFNLGFTHLFATLGGKFTITSTMQIELGVILLIFIIGTSIQIRFFNVFENRLLKMLSKRSQSAEEEEREEGAARRIRNVMDNDIEKFEHRYSWSGFPFVIPRTLGSPDNYRSGSGSPVAPSYTSHSNTPRSESRPLLTEVVSPSATATEKVGKESEGLLDASLPDAIKRDVKESLELADEIQEKQKKLDEIGVLRANIRQIRASLSSSREGRGTPIEDNEDSHKETPENRNSSRAAMPLVQSVIKPREPTFTAPRPVSRYSQIVIPPRPVSSHSYSKTDIGTLSRGDPVARPASAVLVNSIPPVLDGRVQDATRLIGAGQGPLRTSTTATERVVTGSMPSRPTSLQIPSSSHVRTTSTASNPYTISKSQTMDIYHLDTKHRKRMSELQNAGITQSTVPKFNGGEKKQESSSKSDFRQASRINSIVAPSGDHAEREDILTKPTTIFQPSSVLPKTGAVTSTTNNQIKLGENDWLDY